MLSLQRGLDFSGLGGRSWEQKSIKNQSENEVNMEGHLGIDFSLILVDFGGQVGPENRAKRQPKARKGREGKGRQGKAREGKGKEGQESEGKGSRGGILVPVLKTEWFTSP